MQFQYTNIISLDRDTGAHFASQLFCGLFFFFNVSAGGGEWVEIRRAFRPQACLLPGSWAPPFAALLVPCNLRRTRIKAPLGQKLSF